MGYCTFCGKEHKDNSVFCENCGAKNKLDCENIELPENQHCKKTNGVSKRKKIIIFSIVALILCSVFLGILLLNSLEETNNSPRSIGLNVEYSEKGISRFLKKVCKNVSGKAEIADSNSDSPGNIYGECYIPVVKVKRSGKVAEEIPIRFYNSGSSDTVSTVEMILYSFDTRGFSPKDYENIFECEKALLIALEKTVAGKSYVDDYLTSYHSVCIDVSRGEINKTVILATYELSDELSVVVETKNGGNAWGTWVTYTLKKESSR